MERKYLKQFDRLEDGVRRKVEHFLYELRYCAADAICPISFDINDLVDDLMMNSARFKVNREKYFRKLPKNFLTGSVIKYVKEHDLLERFIDLEDKISTAVGESPFYLTKTGDGRYRFFMVSLPRPGYFTFEEYFDRLEDAVRRKIDYFMLEVGQRAVDEIYPFPFSVPELVNDLIANRYLYNLEKYSHKLPLGLKISSIMDYIKENNLFENFVDKEYESGVPYGTPIFLILNEDKKYEFFYLERLGLEMGMMYFDRIEDGVRRKIESYLGDFGHRAPDAIYAHLY